MSGICPAARVIELAQATRRPYAVFLQRTLEMVPADGERYAKLQKDPSRMAHCVGVFDEADSADEVRSAIMRMVG